MEHEETPAKHKYGIKVLGQTECFHFKWVHVLKQFKAFITIDLMITIVFWRKFALITSMSKDMTTEDKVICSLRWLYSQETSKTIFQAINWVTA